jgi:general stress protein 26
MATARSEPAPEQDIRFGDPTSPPTPWSATLEVLEASELFWISTVRTDGRPHVTPLPAIWHDDRLHFCTGLHEQKARNLEQNQHVALTTGGNRWKEGLDVVVEGTVGRVVDGARLQSLADLWRGKYSGDWDFAVEGDVFVQGGSAAAVFEVVPTKVLAFAKGQFAQTRYRF